MKSLKNVQERGANDMKSVHERCVDDIKVFWRDRTLEFITNDWV